MREDWKYLPLGEICDILDSKRKPITKNKRLVGSIPYYGATGILDYVKDYIFEEKLVLLGEDGAKWGAGENSAYIINGKTWVNNHAHVLRPRRDIICDEFLVCYLNYTDLSDSITGVTVPKLNQEKMRAISIPVPPLPEQERIVSLLDTQFAKIDALKANAASQLQAAKDLFQSALKQLLTPQKGWEEKKLYELYDVRDGTHDSPKYVEEGYPLVTSKNLKNGGIDMTTVKYIKKSDYEKINERSKVDVGDVLFAMIGTIGNPSLVEDEPNYAIKNMALFKVPRCQNSKFLKYILSSDEIINRMKGQASGSNQPFVSLGYLRNFTIQIPFLPEQERIAARLDTISEKVKALQANYDQTINLCNDLKQSLLKSIFA